VHPLLPTHSYLRANTAQLYSIMLSHTIDRFALPVDCAALLCNHSFASPL